VTDTQGSNVSEHGVGLNVGLKGQQGIDLRQHWLNIGGPQAYQGTAVPGVSTSCWRVILIQFPNYFAVLGPNSIAGSWGYTIGVKTSFNALLIKAVGVSAPNRLSDVQMVKEGLASMQPTQGAFEKHNQEVQLALKTSNMRSLQCENWWRIGGQGLLSVPAGINGYESIRK
jgi:hypothetical protein